MIRLAHVISDPEGLHARNAATLASEVRRWESGVVACVDGVACDAADMMALMSLEAGTGSMLFLDVEGSDESDAASSLTALLGREL